MRLAGIIAMLGLVGASACTEIGLVLPGQPQVTVYDCEAGYSEALAKGGKTQAQIENALDQCLGQVMLKTGTDPSKRPVYIVRQSAQTVVVSPQDYAATHGTAPATHHARQGQFGCPPGFRGMYRGTLFCTGH